LAYNPNFATLKEDYVKTSLVAALTKFSDFLGDQPYFAGDSVTFPDFPMYEMLYSHRILAPEVVNKFPSLVAFIGKIEALPRISDFLKSDRSPKPLNNKMASFGNA
jgi:glutathione S-transferase